MLGLCLGLGDTILMVQQLENCLTKMGNIMTVLGNKRLRLQMQRCIFPDFNSETTETETPLQVHNLEQKQGIDDDMYS